MILAGIPFQVDFAQDWKSRSRKEALSGLAARIGTLRADISTQDLARSFLNRERLGSTALGAGIAAPHVFHDKACQPLIQITRLDAAIDFDAVDQQPVDLLLAIIGNRQDLKWLLLVLRRFATLGKSPDLANRIRAAQGIADVEDVLAQVGLYTERTYADQGALTISS